MMGDGAGQSALTLRSSIAIDASVSFLPSRARVRVYDPDNGLYYDCGFTLDPTPGI
jgi:hypothetical protein